jgi:hypothetical protein
MLQPVSQGIQTSNCVRCSGSISSTRGLLMECQLWPQGVTGFASGTAAVHPAPYDSLGSE